MSYIHYRTKEIITVVEIISTGIKVRSDRGTFEITDAYFTKHYLRRI